MNSENGQALARYLTALGDDELILGQRGGEWCGHAPILEEDIAFANLSLDEIGHANVWYGLAAGLLGEEPETYPDRLAFRRRAADFRNVQMVELPNGDWAFSMLRQCLFDSLEVARLEGLRDSQHGPLAEAAVKLRSEEIYHRRHTQAWVKRLALGTGESKRRMQAALDELWPYFMQLGQAVDGEIALAEGGYVPKIDHLRIAIKEEIEPFLQEIELQVPKVERGVVAARDEHSPHFEALIAEMQEVPRQFPEGVW